MTKQLALAAEPATAPAAEIEQPQFQPPGAIFGAISKVMAEVGPVAKDRKNEQQKYSFRGIEDFMNALNPVLARNGIFFMPEILDRDVTERETKNGTTLIYTTLAVRYTFYAKDGSFLQCVVAGEAMDSGDKSTNKAMSAALKYALMQIFCIPTEAQEDADAHTPEDSKPKAAAKAETKTTTPAAAAPEQAGMTERDKLLAQAKDLAETCGGEETKRQLKAFSADRISALTDAQLPHFVAGLQLFYQKRSKAGK